MWLDPFLFAICNIVIYRFMKSLYKLRDSCTLEVDQSVDSFNFAEEDLISFAEVNRSYKSLILHSIHNRLSFLRYSSTCFITYYFITFPGWGLCSMMGILSGALKNYP